MDDYITRVGLYGLNFFSFGEEQFGEELSDKIFSLDPYSRIEYCLLRLDQAEIEEKLFWFENSTQDNKKSTHQQCLILLAILAAIFFIKFFNISFDGMRY